MMDILQKGFWRFILVIIVAAAVAGYCTAATPAGTVISAAAHCTYANSGGTAMPTANSNTISVTVTASAALSISVDSASTTVSPGGTAKYKVIIQNLGGAADIFTASAATASTGWQAGVFVDANGNGTIDSGELKSSVQTPSIQPNSTYTFTVAMVAPAGAAAGTSATANVSVVSTTNSLVNKSTVLTATVQNSSYIRKWSALSPFAAVGTPPITYDYLAGEANAVPGVIAGGHNWTTFTSASDTVNLGSVFSNWTNCVTYAGVYVYSGAAQSASLLYTSTGTGQVWMNGAAVYTEQTLPADPTQARKVPVQLLQGWNRLILKLGETAGPWQFSAMFADGSGAPLANINTDTTRQPQTAITIGNVTTGYVDSYSAKLQWTTSSPTSTILTYASATSGNKVYQDPALTLQHTASLSNLQAGSIYSCTPSGLDVYGYGVKGLASSFQTSPAVNSVWITNWLINGTYKYNGYSSMLATDYLSGEPYIQPYEGLYTNNRRWASAAVNSWGTLNFSQYYPSSYNCCAYAHVYIYSPYAQNAYLLTGSNDGIRAWLNGRLILNKDVRRNLVTDQDRTLIVLTQGWNRLLVKVSQYDGMWQMCARLTNVSGGALSGMQYRINRP